MNESLCILVRRSPYGTIHATEALRHLAGALSSGLKVAEILVDDGIYMAKDGQEAVVFGWTSLSESLSFLLSKEKGEDIKVYVHGPSLRARGMEKEKFIEGIELIDDKKLAELLGASHSVMLF
jgi:sulfur relay (sulfurtransferase) DsrF/TusC family protein